nr:MAG TPA: hypothetical protein [Caudoviricetes sp.]
MLLFFLFIIFVISSSNSLSKDDVSFSPESVKAFFFLS